MINRRSLIAGACGAVAVGGISTAGAVLMRPASPLLPVRPDGLRYHAARRGMSFGCMIFAPQIAADPDLMKLVVAEADMLVPGIEMKWGVIEKTRSRPDYGGADATAAFAAGHGLRLRGHAGFWYRNIPGWSAPLLAGPDAAALMVARVSEVVGRYRGRVFEWDVVNEAIEPTDGLPNGMRRAPFQHATDYGWIADCFHAAHEADPAARLFYNDYSFENDIKRDADRRGAALALLTDLKRRGAPIHGLGLQTHIGVGQRFSARVYRTFLQEVAALGLDMRLTEFDVASVGPDDIAVRDQAVADQAAPVLETAFEEPAVKGMLCWGLSDGYAGLGPKAPVLGPTGVAQRGLPFDDGLRRKPLWTTIARAFDGAPSR